MTHEVPPFVLLGHHRGGTSFMSEVIRTHPLVELLNEPFSQHLEAFRDDDLLRWSDADGAGGLPAELLNLRATEDYLVDLRAWLRASTAVEIHGFKETALFEKLDWLVGYFGPLRGVVIVRDPRAVVASVLRRGLQSTWWSHRARLIRWAGAGGAVPDGVDFGDDASVTAAVWGLRMSWALDTAERCGWSIVRLEEVLAVPEVAIGRVMATLELDLHSTQVAFMARSWEGGKSSAFSCRRLPAEVTETWRGVLTDAQQRAIERVARPEMERLGYMS